jgi:hypothetical protein
MLTITNLSAPVIDIRRCGDRFPPWRRTRRLVLALISNAAFVVTAMAELTLLVAVEITEWQRSVPGVTD